MLFKPEKISSEKRIPTPTSVARLIKWQEAVRNSIHWQKENNLEELGVLTVYCITPRVLMAQSPVHHTLSPLPSPPHQKINNPSV